MSTAGGELFTFPALGGSCRLLGVLAADLDPVGGPCDCELLRHGPGARVVEHDVADAARAELREDRVEAPAAVAEGLRVGAIAERDDAVLHTGEVRTLALQRRVEMLRVVRDVALPVCRGADQEQAAWREHARIQAVHRLGLHLRFGAVERELDFLRDELRRAGHGTDEDGQLERHRASPGAFPLRSDMRGIILHALLEASIILHSWACLVFTSRILLNLLPERRKLLVTATTSPPWAIACVRHARSAGNHEN